MRRCIISSTTLHRFLLEAETIGNESEDRGALAPGAKKWKRARTPPEEISSDDERKFTREEDEAEARSESPDEDYHPI